MKDFNKLSLFEKISQMDPGLNKTQWLSPVPSMKKNFETTQVRLFGTETMQAWEWYKQVFRGRRHRLIEEEEVFLLKGNFPKPFHLVFIIF